MQLVLPVLHSYDSTIDNFVAAQNTPLLEHLKQQIIGTGLPNQGKPIVFVHGAEGAGKTHLLLAIHQLAEVSTMRCQYIDMQELKSLPSQIVTDIGLNEVLCIDNIDAISADQAWQIQLFNEINKFLEKSGRCLLVSSKAPTQVCKFSLPDLASRLTWGTTFHLHELNDEDKTLALDKHFQERGISVQHDVLLFLMKRSQRDMHKLMALAEQLDKLSLQSKRKLTIPFVKQALSL